MASMAANAENYMAYLPLDDLSRTANAYASANGIQVEKKTSNENGPVRSYYQCAPMSLLPNAFPAKRFEQAKSIAPAFNLLVDRISRDPVFLQQTLGDDVANADPYTKKLLQMYQQIYHSEDSKSQFALTADYLGIHRSDYMLHDGGLAIKQIELNTIAASFAGLSSKIAQLHSFVLRRYHDNVDLQGFLETNRNAVLLGEDQQKEAPSSYHVPENPTMDRLPAAISVAYKRYEERFLASEPIRPLVLFVVQPDESNTVDQRLLEFNLFERHQIPVVRMSLDQINREVFVDDQTGALKIGRNGDKAQSEEIALVYFRAGYAPTDYPDGYDGVEWQARAKIEASRATKCPSLGYHLAGTKKVQQQLARPGQLEYFIDQIPGIDEFTKATWIEGMRAVFAGLYSLGHDMNEQDLLAVKDALAGGHGKYVLKPQREGGGYNFYGSDLAKKLKENVKEESGKLTLDKKLGEFILMERLFPPQQKAVLLRTGLIEGTGDSISELGCYGAIVVSHDGRTVLHNDYAGFLLRTKFSNVDEGGVASGFATLSSPYLC